MDEPLPAPQGVKCAMRQTSPQILPSTIPRAEFIRLVDREKGMYGNPPAPQAQPPVAGMTLPPDSSSQPSRSNSQVDGGGISTSELSKGSKSPSSPMELKAAMSELNDDLEALQEQREEIAQMQSELDELRAHAAE